jgi:hypothetical protein
MSMSVPSDPIERVQASSRPLTDILIELLGQPTSEGFPRWRWRGKGSLSVRIDTGKWSDFSTGEWGSIEDLVMRERGRSISPVRS